MNIILYFFVFPISAGAALSLAWIIPYGPHAIPLLVISLASYCVGFILDVKSTALFGTATVCSLEESPLFRITCRKLGFRGAIMVQVPAEMLIVFLVIPFALLRDVSIIASSLALFVLCAIHCFGYHVNTSLYQKVHYD